MRRYPLQCGFPFPGEAAMSDSTTVQLEALLEKFRTGDPAAKNGLINVAKERLLKLTSQLLGGFPRGREHDDTTGIFNESYLRLHTALDEVKPTTVRQDRKSVV